MTPFTLNRPGGPSADGADTRGRVKGLRGGAGQKRVFDRFRPIKFPQAIVLGAAYMLRLTQKVMLGEPGSDLMEKLTDLDMREKLTLGFLVILIFVLGIFPNLILDMTEATINTGIIEMFPGHLAGLGS